LPLGLFPVISISSNLFAHPFFWHVWPISMYFPWFGSVYPPSWTILWLCISDSLSLSWSFPLLLSKISSQLWVFCFFLS
jgi:hypothetical protein